MTESDAFENARRSVTSAHETKSDLCRPFLAVAPVTGASVSVLTGSHQATMCSSDPTAARLDEMQFDLGEGPCWEAMQTRRPVLAPDLRSEHHVMWPVFMNAIRGDALNPSVEAIFAFPLAVGSLDIGAIDLYSSSPVDITTLQVTNVMELAGVTAWQVLRRILVDGAIGVDEEDGLAFTSRREVHQATGMILAQLGLNAADAALLLRAHAFSTDRSVRDVANDVVARRIDFSADGRP